MGKDYDFKTLGEMEQSGEAFRSFINPDDPMFANPPSMLGAIKEYCKKTGQPVPETDAQIARLIMESMALRYCTVFGWLKELASFPLEVLHIIGGGCQNALLAQWTANSIGCPALCGPIEATAIGNIMVQFKAIGKVKDITEMRALIAKAIELKRYEPQDTEAWKTAYKRYTAICEQ